MCSIGALDPRGHRSSLDVRVSSREYLAGKERWTHIHTHLPEDGVNTRSDIEAVMRYMT